MHKVNRAYRLNQKHKVSMSFLLQVAILKDLKIWGWRGSPVLGGTQTPLTGGSRESLVPLPHPLCADLKL